MEFTTLPGTESILRVANEGPAPLISSAQEALDLIATARYYHTAAVALILQKADIGEDFFDLKTGLAGEVLQKFVNYQMKLAIVGDFSHYTSKSLRDFIRESNRGNAVFFVADEQEAAQKLGGAPA